MFPVLMRERLIVRYRTSRTIGGRNFVKLMVYQWIKTYNGGNWNSSSFQNFTA